MKNKLPDLYTNVYIANEPSLCAQIMSGITISPDGKITRTPAVNPYSYGIELEMYVDREDVGSDVGYWEQKKVDDYRRLVEFMNSKGWYWAGSHAPGDRYFRSAFLPSNILLTDVMTNH